MRSFQARTLLDTPRHRWPCGNLEKFKLIFDDGDEIVTNTYRTEDSFRIWSIHARYPKLDVLKRHHVGTGSLSNDRLQDIMSAIVEDIHILYYGDPDYNREEVWRTVYETMQKLYNEWSTEYSEYVRGANSFTYDELYFYPPIAAIRNEILADPTDINIDDGYAKAVEVLMKDPLLQRNTVVSQLRAKLVKMEQLLQILLIRGFNTDIDSYRYSKPILGNYHSGIIDAAEAAMESTLAAKAIIFTGQPLEQTEYANRKMQFSSHQVDLLVMNDCGSTTYGTIEITPSRFKDMDGLYYLDPDTQRLKPIRQTDKHLIGETRQFRLPFFCNYRHHNCICEKCYGLLAFNIPYGFNLGHLASTMTQSVISQRVLKVKHSEASGSIERINISQEERAYIIHAPSPNEIRLNPEMKGKGVKLLLKANAHQGLLNASRLPTMKASHITEPAAAARLSQFKDVTFEIAAAEEGKNPQRYHVAVSRGGRLSYLTSEFLRFFLDQKFKIRDDGYYHIELDEWDFKKSAFALPNRQTSMKDLAAEIEVFIRSTRDSSMRHLGGLKQLRHYDDPTEALLDMHELIAETAKVPVAFTHCAVVMTSMLVGRYATTDMRIPPLGEPARFGKYDQIMQYRSMGPLLAYQGGAAALNDMEQYLNTDRDQHLMDCLSQI
jgi:hypothetical protein